MEIIVKENRELIIKNPESTQNENDVQTIYLTVPEQYEDFDKKIAFVTEEGVKWGLVENNMYKLERSITKFENVLIYVWLTKDDQDFRSVEEALTFNKNHKVDGEITPEEQTDMERVISILESEIIKTENLESQVDGKLEEIDTAIDNVNSAIQETENLDLDAEKVNKTTTVTITKKDGTEKSVSIQDGQDGQDGEDLQFMWQGTSLGVKTENQEQYTFVNLQGVQGPAGPQGEPFTIKKTYASISQMNADFNNMQLGDYVMIASTVELEDNAKLYTKGESQWIFITDFSGATGVKGETGLTPNIQIGTVTQGSSFSVTRTGTNENPILNFTLVKGDKGDKGEQGDDYVLTAQDKEEIAEMVDAPVDDVQINGTSIVEDGVANVPVATMPTSGADAGNLGLTCFKRGRGISINTTDNSIYIDYPSLAQVKAGNDVFKPVTTAHQHESAFYGLAKAAGDATQSASSNAVGNYTEDAKIAIQKMLGIYEAPWELIREDTFTNEEETSHEITTDGNGLAFELTDIRIIFWLPVQNVDASLGDYGKVQAYYTSNKYDTNYLTAFTQVAGSASKVGIASWEQKNGMIELTFLSSGTNGTSKAISSIIRSDGSPNAFMYVPEGRIYTKVVIPSVKGTGTYKLYGRRKWQ